jgi:hypothetical protein
MLGSIQPTAQLDDVRWLVSREGSKTLDFASTLTGELTTRLKRLRATLTPERARLVLEQVDLRRRAREKFTAAEKMFFTPQGLEQATDETIARY